MSEDEYIPLNIETLRNCADPQKWAEEFVRVTRENDVDPRNELLMYCWFLSAMEVGRRDVLERLVKGEDL